MKSIKVIELINSLNFREFDGLGYFIKSGGFGNKYFIKVYNYFKKHRGGNESQFKKNDCAKYVFGQNVKDTKLRLLLSDFSIVLEKYLVFRFVENNYEQYQKSLLDQYRHRGVLKNYNMLLKKLEKERERKSVMSIEDYFWEAQIECSKVMYKENRLKNQLPEPYTEALKKYDNMFILLKLHYDNLNTISKSPVIPNKQSNSFLINEIVVYVEANEEFFKSKHIYIYIEFLVFRLLRDYSNYRYYSDLLKYTQQYYEKIDKVYLTHIFYIFNTYLINKINIVNEIEDHKKFFEVVKVFYSRRFFDEYGLIPGYLFYNCINAALKTDDVLFAEEFYDAYNENLDAGKHSDIVKLSYIQILMKKKRYESAIVAINKLQSNNFHIYLNSRMFILVIFYELNYVEDILYTIDALKHYLNRHKSALGGWYERFSKFIYYLNKLINLKAEEIKKKDRLIVQIKNGGEFAGKGWLLSKIEK